MIDNDIFVVPKTYEELEKYSHLIVSKLIDRYRKNKRFDDAVINSDGLIYQCSGLISLLLIANTFDKITLDEDMRDIILTELQKVFSHLEEKGYDVTPLIPDEKTESYFSPGSETRYHYLDSVAWVLSLMLQLRLAFRNEKLRIEEKDMNKIKIIIKQAIEIICDGAHPEGGWGFTKGTKKSDLYYSYAISESLADFGDYILGETPDIAVEDEEIKEFLGTTLIQEVEDKRKNTSAWLINTYLPDLGTKMICPSNAQIIKDEHILLYYTYFVIDMLIVCKADMFFEEKKEEIKQSIEHGIYLCRIAFDKAKADKDWWADADKSSLPLKWDNHEVIDRNIPTGSNKLSEPGLIPLSLRCNALYAYYIAKGEDKKMDDLFKILFSEENRCKKTGLWDDIGFSLIITERAIEALVDYADYIRNFRAELIGNQTLIESQKGAMTIEDTFNFLVRKAVDEYLNSSDVINKLHSMNKSNTEHYSEGEEFQNIFLDSLINTLAISEQIMFGRDIGYDINKGEYNRLISQVSKFFSTLLINRLKITVKEEQHQTIINNFQEQQKEILSWIAERLAIDKKQLDIHYGDVLTWIIDEYNKKRR